MLEMVMGEHGGKGISANQDKRMWLLPNLRVEILVPNITFN